MAPYAAEEAPQSEVTPKLRMNGHRETTGTAEPALLHRSLRELPEKVVGSHGICLELADGRTIIDACGGAAVSILGYDHGEAMATAASDQILRAPYVHTGHFTTDSAEDLAHIVLDGNPHGLARALFVGSGSEAMDGAMKIARQFFFEQGQTQRTNFVSRLQGYHGNTLGAMSVSANLPRKVPYQPFQLPIVSHVTPAFAYRYQRQDETEARFAARLVAEVEAEFKRLGTDTVVAFVAETVVGATAGCVAAPRGYWRGIRTLCDTYGVLLVMDEVMCGTGRTGSFFAFAQEDGDIRPDIVTIGKGLGSGYAPIAGILLGDRLVEGLRQSASGAINHGHTYQCHPVSSAVALAVQRTLRRDRLVEACRDRGVYLGAKLKQAFGASRHVGDIRGRGLFWALELVQDRTTKEPLAPSLHAAVSLAGLAMDRGLLVYPGSGTIDGTRGDHVILAPPYTVTEEQLDEIVALLKTAYDQFEKTVQAINI